MANLEGFVLVIGAGSGIGRETGLLFAERGASGVVFADINLDAAKSSADQSKQLAINPSYKALALFVDVTDRSSVENLVQETRKAFTRIDYAVNSAGVGASMEAPLWDMPTEEFDRVYNINGRGTFFCTSEISKVMKEQEERFVTGRSGRRSIGRGSIVNLTSLNGIIPVPGHAQYGSSKFAAVGVTLTAAVDLARLGVRINNVMPSWVDTPAGLLDGIKSLCPLGRMAKVEEIAEVVHFLHQPGASYIHGASLSVDYGLNHTRGLA